MSKHATITNTTRATNTNFVYNIIVQQKEVHMLNAINQLLGIAVKLMLVGVLLITGGIVDIIDFD